MNLQVEENEYLKLGQLLPNSSLKGGNHVHSQQQCMVPPLKVFLPSLVGVREQTPVSAGGMSPLWTEPKTPEFISGDFTVLISQSSGRTSHPLSLSGVAQVGKSHLLVA